MNNTVRDTTTFNNITVVTDQTQVSVTQPLTSVVEIATLGPVGPQGPQGEQGPVGPAGQGIFTLVGDNLWATTSSLLITGSLTVSSSGTFTNIGPAVFSGSINVLGDSSSNIFIIKNQNNYPVLTVSQSGVIILATQSTELTSAAPVGGMYFTSASFYVGLE
jgi:hypothetical protein